MSFWYRLKNAWNIFKLSFSLLKKDKSLIAIPVLMLLSLIILMGIFWYLNYVQILYRNYITYLIFLFVMYFILTFLAAAQSWMVYEVLRGKDTTVKSGFKRAIQNFGDILTFVFTVILIRIFSSWLRKKGMIGQAAGSFIDYVTGIAGKLVLPAMIITERNFKDSVIQLKDSLKAIPEIAIYEIGIRPLTALFFFIGVFITILLSFSSFIFPIFGFLAGIIFLLIWLLIMMLLSVYVNNTYYTILYLTLIEKKKIPGLKLAK